MIIYTIGFTKKTAEQFFECLRASGASRLIDVRLKNVSQLAGFSKRDDLKYFARTICRFDYLHLPLLAPTQDILEDFKKRKGEWSVYEQRFLALMSSRQIDIAVSREQLDHACLLCSEDTAHHCHRRLVAEYLAKKWGDVEIVHL